MRITSVMQSTAVTKNLMSSQSDLAKLQNQLATQKKVNAPSDSPSTVSNIMDASLSLDKIEIYKDNITILNGQSEVIESTLSQVTDVLQRANELTIQSANATESSDQLKMINDEMKQLKEQLVSLANTSYEGSYIFSGNKTTTPAYSIADDGSIVYQGTPQTGDYKREYSVADNVTVSLNQPGDKIFGYSNLVSEGPPPVYEGEGVMQTINELTVLLDSDTPDYDAIRAKIDEIGEASNTVLTARTENGGVQSRLTLTEEQHETNKVNYTTIKSNLQDVDVSEIVSELSAQEVALQASLYVSSSVMQLSLLDYL